MILLADTNILIDLEYVGGIGVLPKLAPCEILDVVLAECESQKQPLIIEHIEQSGISIIKASHGLVSMASSLRRGGVSTNDMMTFCHAREHGHTVLTGDRPLRERCREEGVDYRGCFWIVEEIQRLGLLESAELLRWLTVWPQVGRRLPKEELDSLCRMLKS